MISVELVPPGQSNWETYGTRIYEIERSIFGEKSLDKEMMRSDINDPKTTLIVLKDGDSIVGFTYALPESEGVARIVDTVFLKEYQGRGFVAMLMARLEAELRKNKYIYVTRDVMIENGYADKVMKNYSSRIVATKEFTGTWGKQRYFKIRL
jgi:ribosomal protein S18 acetylase RimI-like enzyme